MLKTFFNDNNCFIKIKPKPNKKYLTINKTLTPIKLVYKNTTNIFNKKTNTTINLKKINNKNENIALTKSRNFNDINNLNTEYNNSFSNYIKTTMDTNMTRTRKENNLSFINDNTFIHFTPSTNYQSSNVKNKNKRKRIKIPKQKEKFFLSKNKVKNINKTFIIPNRLNSLLNVEQNIINPIKQKSKIFFRKSISLNKKVNNIKDKINIINQKQKTLGENSLLIKKAKIKNICKLFEHKIESIPNKEKIKQELNKSIMKLENKIKKIKKETNNMNINKEKIKEEINEDKNRIIKYKKEIDKIKNDKKKVNAMLILLHKRIIDIKNRIKRHDEHNLYLDQSFFQLNQQYQNFI